MARKPKVIGPVDGICKFFNGTYGFFTDPVAGVDVFVHRSNLPNDSGGRCILPRNSGAVRFSYGPSEKAGHEGDYDVVGTVEIIDRYVPANRD